jgi:hypothetical protein
MDRAHRALDGDPIKDGALEPAATVVRRSRRSHHGSAQPRPRCWRMKVAGLVFAAAGGSRFRTTQGSVEVWRPPVGGFGDRVVRRGGAEPCGCGPGRRLAAPCRWPKVWTATRPRSGSWATPTGPPAWRSPSGPAWQLSRTTSASTPWSSPSSTPPPSARNTCAASARRCAKARRPPWPGTRENAHPGGIDPRGLGGGGLKRLGRRGSAKVAVPTRIWSPTWSAQTSARGPTSTHRVTYRMTLSGRVGPARLSDSSAVGRGSLGCRRRPRSPRPERWAYTSRHRRASAVSHARQV